MAKLHPLSVVGKMLGEKLKEVIFKTGEFSLLFYELRKKGDRLTLTLKFTEKGDALYAREKL